MKKQKVTGIIQTYSRRARDQIIMIGTDFFKEVGLERYISDVFSCVDELIKNAVKANYKFLLILQKIAEKIRTEESDLSETQIRNRINDIIKNKPLYDSLDSEITQNEAISLNVRQILNEESKLIRLKDKIYNEKRNYSDEEKLVIDGLVDLQWMRTELERRVMGVRVIIEVDDSYVYIEVTNNAPMMEKDLSRIYDKRDEYKVYRDEGREHEFYLNNLDTSDSGFGLGYATIDSFIGGMGLDPFKTIQIIAASNTTVILSLPIEVLKSAS